MNFVSTSSSIQEITSLIEQQSYSEAIEILKTQIKEKPSAEKSAMLGIAYFRSELYALAADAFREALKSESSNIYWKEMVEKCMENTIAEVKVQVPGEYLFEREKLLSPPVVKPGSIPSDALIKFHRYFFKIFRY